MKKCVSCKKEKEFISFSKNKNSKDGYKNYCKDCARLQNKRYREKHREKINERNKQWYENSKNNKELRTKKALEKGYKICSQCKLNKKITDYYKRGNGGFYGECKDCHKNKTKIYVANNRDLVLERKRKYHLKNRDKHLLYFKEYSLKNSEINVERSRLWRKNNPKKYNELMSLAQNRRRAKLKEVINNFTREDWKKCKDYFRNSNGFVECAYCNKEMKNATQEHFIPIDKGGNHTPDNIIPICLNCNSKKSASDFYDWYPTMEFYSKDNVKKIEHYFDKIKQNKGNHEPSL